MAWDKETPEIAITIDNTFLEGGKSFE